MSSITKSPNPIVAASRPRGARASFGALAEALADTRTRLAELEAREAQRLQTLAEYVGRSVLAQARDPDVRDTALVWLRRQQDGAVGSALEREILEDFLTSLELEGEAHER